MPAQAQAEHGLSRLHHSDVRDAGAARAWALAVDSDFATAVRVGHAPGPERSFRTTIAGSSARASLGDFEYLVRLLKAKPADERVGRRDMDLQQPGWNLPGLDPDGPLGGILRLGGALRVPEEVIQDLEEYRQVRELGGCGSGLPATDAAGDREFPESRRRLSEARRESAADSGSGQSRSIRIRSSRRRCTAAGMRR